MIGGMKTIVVMPGHRAFSRCLLWALALNENDDDFVFDNHRGAQTKKDPVLGIAR